MPDVRLDSWGGKPGNNAAQVSPEDKHRLRGILRHYAKSPHPFRACVVGSTPIDAPRDMERWPEGVPINHVRPGDLVWSFNAEVGVFELKPVKWVEITRHKAQLCLVTLDSGKQIRCTPDHRFMRRDGSWVEAQNLAEGDSLMPLYRDFMPLVRLDPNRTAFQREYKVVGEALGRQEGEHTHHIDYRVANSDPRNLTNLTPSEHARLHHEVAAEREVVKTCKTCGGVFVAENKNQKHCSSCPEYLREFVGGQGLCTVCGDLFVKRAHNQRYCSKACRHSVREDRTTLSDERICTVCGEGFKPNSGPQKICSDECREVAKVAYSERAATRKRNHKVASVHLLLEFEDVWDMEVEGNHNFVVHGVVLHNCVRDNTKRFGEERAKRICAVVKDLIRGTTHWRGKNNPNDKGSAGLSEDESVCALLPDDLCAILWALTDEQVQELKRDLWQPDAR